ncbi:MAG: ribose-5-phosphate isomerase RpiA [Psittacicella sp.]
MTQNELKKMAALEALKFIKDGDIVGIGSGSTVFYFIEALANSGIKIQGAVTASVYSEDRLRNFGIKVIDPNTIESIDYYFDGADEIDPNHNMIKGGGAALTGEKIIASIAKKFVCLVDETKLVDVLGAFPVPIEVIPKSSSYVIRELQKLGAKPVIRECLITEYGNLIIDTLNLPYIDKEMEIKLNSITGVVMNGIFSVNKADIVIKALASGIEIS